MQSFTESYTEGVISFTELYSPFSQGIRFLIEKGLVNSTAEDLGLFLFVSQLDKKAIGDYLGEG